MESNEMFQGFSNEAIEFLWSISLNNCKQWVDEHRHEYKQYLAEPIKALGKELETYVNQLNKDIPCVSTVSRINRDVRFSKNKNPYKESIWFTLKPISEDWKNRPVYFFELKAMEYVYGMGYYYAEPSTMLKFRKYVDENLDETQKMIETFSKQNIFVIEGDKYKRKFNVNYDDNIMDWYTRKNIDLMCHNKIDKLLFSPQLVDKLKEDFKLINHIYKYMWKLHAK